MKVKKGANFFTTGSPDRRYNPYKDYNLSRVQTHPTKTLNSFIKPFIAYMSISECDFIERYAWIDHNLTSTSSSNSKDIKYRLFDGRLLTSKEIKINEELTYDFYGIIKHKRRSSEELIEYSANKLKVPVDRIESELKKLFLYDQVYYDISGRVHANKKEIFS